jgi:transposase
VPVKSLQQQDMQTLHRVRERLVQQRTSLDQVAYAALPVKGLRPRAACFASP